MVDEGHFIRMRCRKAGGHRCASLQEEMALHFDETLGRDSSDNRAPQPNQ